MDVVGENTWQVGFLPSLNSDTQEKLLSLAEVLHFKQDDMIFRQNDPALHLYIVKSGIVGIESFFPSRGFHQMVTLGPGELFSWSALVEPRHETATARAVEDMEVFAFSAGKISDQCLEDPVFGYEIYKALAGVISSRLKATRREFQGLRASA